MRGFKVPHEGIREQAKLLLQQLLSKGMWHCVRSWTQAPGQQHTFVRRGSEGRIIPSLSPPHRLKFQNYNSYKSSYRGWWKMSAILICLCVQPMPYLRLQVSEQVRRYVTLQLSRRAGEIFFHAVSWWGCSVTDISHLSLLQHRCSAKNSLQGASHSEKVQVKKLCTGNCQQGKRNGELSTLTILNNSGETQLILLKALCRYS